MKPPIAITKRKAPWQPLTRRAFVALIGAAATALAVRHGSRTRATDDDCRRTAARTTRWIGHC